MTSGPFDHITHALKRHHGLPAAVFCVAFALRGAKEPVFLAVVFLLSLMAFFAGPAVFNVPRRLGGAVALFLVWLLVAALFFPPLDLHFLSISKMCAALAFGLLFFSDTDGRAGRSFAATVVALSVIESVVCLTSPRAAGVGGVLLGNPVYSALLIGAGLLASVRFLDVPERVRNWRMALIVLLAVVQVSGLLATGNRAVWVGLVVGIIATAGRRGRRFAGVALGAAVFWALIQPHWFLGVVKVSVDHPQESLVKNYGGRLIIWRTALSAFEDRWVSGVGLGNFERAYLRYQKPVPSDTLAFGRTTRFAHNDYLQLGVEGGLPALALFLLVLAAWARHWGRRERENWLTDWAGGVVFLHIGASLFNFSVFLPLNAFAAVACAAIVVRATLRRKRDAVPFRRRWAVVVSLAPLLFLTAYGVSEHLRRQGDVARAARVLPVRGDVLAELAIQRLRAGDANSPSGAEAVISILRRADLWSRGDPFVVVRLAKVLAASDPGRGAEITRLFERALAAAPRHAPFWLDAGAYRFLAGDLVAARHHFDVARALEPNASRPVYLLGVVAMRAGDVDAAQALIKESVELRRRHGAIAGWSPYAAEMFRQEGRGATP